MLLVSRKRQWATNVNIEDRDDEKGFDGHQDNFAPRKGEAQGLDNKIQERLGRQLKALYDDVVKQPVPDKLLSLMAQLEQAKGPDGK